MKIHYLFNITLLYMVNNVTINITDNSKRGKKSKKEKPVKKPRKTRKDKGVPRPSICRAK
jgi:hypothetical protein